MTDVIPRQTSRRIQLMAADPPPTPQPTQPVPHLEYNVERFGGQVLSSSVRPATAEEIEAARSEYQTTGQCDHRIIVDTSAWLYDVRTCYTCKSGIGLI